MNKGIFQADVINEMEMKKKNCKRITKKATTNVKINT